MSAAVTSCGYAWLGARGLGVAKQGVTNTAKICEVLHLLLLENYTVNDLVVL